MRKRLQALAPPMIVMALAVTDAQPIGAQAGEQIPTRDTVVTAIEKRGGRPLAKGYRASWSHDGKRIAFGRLVPSDRGATAGGVAILDLKSGTVTAVTDAGKDAAWAPIADGLLAYARGTGKDEELWVVEPSGKNDRKVADGGYPSWSADGKTLFFRGHRDGALRLLAVEWGHDGPLGEPTIIRDISSWYPAVSFDGKQFAYRTKHRLVVVGQEQTDRTRTWRLPEGAGFLGGWSPDGKRLAFGGYGGSDPLGLWVLNVETGQAVQFAPGYCTLPVWSPDGSKLAFDVRDRTGFEIWLVEAKALDGLQPALMCDPYELPSGGVDELLEFVEDLRKFPPTTREQTRVDLDRRAEAIRQAAEQILLSADRSSAANEIAIAALLESRLLKLGSMKSEEQRQVLEQVRGYLAAGTGTAFVDDAKRLTGLVLAQVDDWTDRDALIAETCKSFAELLSKRQDAKLDDRISLLQGVAHRFDLVGNEMKIEGTTLGGAALDMSAYGGKTVLIDFWTSWCPFCWPEIVHTKEIYEAYHDRGLEVIGISLDRDRKRLEDWLKSVPLPWTVVHDEKLGWNQPTASYYGVLGVPTMILINADGKVVSIQARGEELERQLEKLLPHPALSRTPRRSQVTSDTGRKPLVNSIGMKLVLVPAGEFLMGSSETNAELVEAYGAYHPNVEKSTLEADFALEHPQHRVRISEPFYLGIHEVTVGQFRRFVDAEGYRTDAERNGSGSLGTEDSRRGQESEYTWRSTAYAGFVRPDDHPVIHVSWNDAMAFCRWLSRQEDVTYRLPTEAEWEYACRAGTTTRYYHGDNVEGLTLTANVADAILRAESGVAIAIRGIDGYQFTAPVGTFRPNRFGLYDMHGNVSEWCADWFDSEYYGDSPLEDPPGPSEGSRRVLRGGDCYNGPAACRSAFRSAASPDYREGFTGFRVVRSQSGR